jgi:D-alanine-D-alanine ligase
MNIQKIKVIVVYGGKSGEHEVSLRSARSVIAAIDKDKYDVVPLAIAKDGRWLPGPQAIKLLQSEKKIEKGNEVVVREQDLSLTETGELQGPTVVFPVLHGTNGEDGTIQGMFEMLNVPYVGSGVIGSALGMDKVVQKELFAFHNIPVVPFIYFLKRDWEINDKVVINRVLKTLQFPMFVKPANLGSSVGITKAHSEKELVKAILEALKFDSKILIEQGIEDMHELEISVLGNENPRYSVCGEVLPANEFYDYNAKYINDNSTLVIPAKIPTEIQKQIGEYAVLAFKVLNCLGLSRVDFFLEKKTNKIWLNEINTMPGFTSISMYPKLWEASGVSYPELVEELIQLGIAKWKEKQEIKTSI